MNSPRKRGYTSSMTPGACADYSATFDGATCEAKPTKTNSETVLVSIQENRPYPEAPRLRGDIHELETAINTGAGREGSPQLDQRSRSLKGTCGVAHRPRRWNSSLRPSSGRPAISSTWVHPQIEHSWRYSLAGLHEQERLLRPARGERLPKPA